MELNHSSSLTSFLRTHFIINLNFAIYSELNLVSCVVTNSNLLRCTYEGHIRIYTILYKRHTCVDTFGIKLIEYRAKQGYKEGTNRLLDHHVFFHATM